MAEAHRDGNSVPVLIGVSSSAPNTAPVEVYVDPTTHRLYVDASITISAASSNVLIYANTAKDGSGTNYVPLVDADGHLQVDILSASSVAVTHAALTELGDAINGSQLDVDLKATDLDLMLGTDFSAVLGTSSLILATQADNVDNASDGLQTSSFGYFFDGTTWDRVRGDSTDGLLVNLGANNDITGTVTANAGTNLNTSLLALESGGNLAAIATSLGSLDNSVDGNYLNVNMNIAGTDVAAGAGTNSAQTLRVTIATDDEVNNLLGTIDADTGSIMTSVQLIDDIIFTAGTDTYTEATSKGGLILAVRRDADTTLANTTNEFVPLQVDANGYLKVEIFDGGGSHTVDNNGTFAVQDATAQASLSVLDDWDETDRAKVNVIVGQAGITAGAGSVAANTPRVTHASDDPVTTALQIMDDWDNGASDGASVSGDVAHDTGDAGEPVKMGMKAVALKANPTEVAANDRTNWYADVSGIPFVLPGHMNTLSQGLQVTDADGAQTDAAIITAGANVAVVVTKVSVVADGANSGDVSVRIGFGTANTPAADAAQVLLFHPGIKAGSGVIEGSGSGILGIGASGEDVRVTCEDPAGGSVSIIVTYFTTDI